MKMSELWAELKSSDNYFPPMDTSPKLELRDQFAMAALTGILMNDNLLPANNELVPYRASGMAYEMADAMLKAREVK